MQTADLNHMTFFYIKNHLILIVILSLSLRF